MKSTKKYLSRISVSIALLSISIIAYQLVLIQILSIVQWYHFAYMIISIAMLGFGAAGTFISLFKRSLLEKAESLLPWLMVITSMLMSASVAISQIASINFDIYHLFDDYTQIWKLAVTYMLFFLPFFCSALSIGIVFVKHVEKIGLLYFSNMIGSGLGGVFAIVIMWWFLPEKLPIIVSIIAFTAAIVSTPQRMRQSFAIIIFIAVAVLSFFYLTSPDLNISEYKSISRTKNLPKSKVIKKAGSPYGMIEIVSAPYLRYAPGLSIKYPGILSVDNVAFNNGVWLDPIISSKNDSLNYFDYSTEIIPYILRERKDVLVLESGTGRQVNFALHKNSRRVVAVESNKALIELLIDDSVLQAGSIYNDKSVILRTISPRTFLLSSHSKFDLITFPIIGSFGGTSGLFALQEQYLLTTESFSEMWSGLKDDGVICITTWIDYPYRNILKILATWIEVLNNYKKGDPNDHIIAIKNWNAVTLLLSHNSFSTNDADTIRNFCKKMNFDPVLLPGIMPEERDYYNKLQDNSFYTLIDKLIHSESEREEVYNDYSFNIKPATDDQPYYSQFLQSKSLSQLSELFGNRNLPFIELGYVLLYVTIFQILLIAVILILTPLFKTGWKGENKTWTLIYFSGLGIGYMFIEIIFIQRFTLYFGNVIYASAAVICLMLLSSGFGSLLSQKFEARHSKLVGILMIIIISLVIYTLILSFLLKATIVFTLTTKIFFSTILIGPPAFLMGMPFPLGLRLLSSKNKSVETSQIPWAWGINGLMSVTSTALATIIAVELGFTWVMIFATLAYVISLMINFRST